MLSRAEAAFDFPFSLLHVLFVVSMESDNKNIQFTMNTTDDMQKTKQKNKKAPKQTACFFQNILLIRIEVNECVSNLKAN